MTTEIPAKLKIRCRRGMLELDIILERYLQNRYEDASNEERAQFVELLDMQDPQLYDLLTGAVTPPDNLANLIADISTPARPTSNL